MTAPGARSASGSTAPHEQTLEMVVAAGPALMASLAPVMTAFGTLAGLGAHPARALATEIVELLQAAGRKGGAVRLRLRRCPQRLRVRLQCGAGAARILRQARPGRTLSGIRVERPRPNALVLSVSGPFRDP